MATTLQDYYEKTADRFWDPLKGATGRDLFVRGLLDGRGGSLLEYGFGSGSLLFDQAKRPEITRVVGVEVSGALVRNGRAALERCGADWASKVELLQNGDDRLPTIESGSIDNVICVATIEHVVDPYVVLDELRRIASPGATLICSVPNYVYLKHRITMLLGGLPRTGTDEPVERWRTCGWDGMHLHTFNKAAFACLLDDCGWNPVQWTGWGERIAWLTRLRMAFPSLLSGELIARCIAK